MNCGPAERIAMKVADLERGADPPQRALPRARGGGLSALLGSAGDQVQQTGPVSTGEAVSAAVCTGNLSRQGKLK